MNQPEHQSNRSLGLSNELLNKIFYYAVPSFWMDDGSERPRIRYCTSYYDELDHFRDVCIVWREVIDSSPNLWVLVESSALNVEECLAKSGNMPLTIDKGLANWERGLGVISRWETADIEFDLIKDWKKGFISMLEANPAPILRELWLTHSFYELDEGLDEESEDMIKVDLFRGIAPRLQVLSLQYISLRNWSAPFLFNLRELSLYMVSGLTMGQLLVILEACTDIEMLKLSVVAFDDPPSTSWTHNPFINCYTIFKTPSCREFTIETNGDDGDPTICSEHVNQLFRSFPTTGEDFCTTVVTGFKSINFTLSKPSGYWPLHVHIDGFLLHSIWSTFIQSLFPETSPELLDLIIDSKNLEVLLETSAWALQGVRKVVLDGSGETLVEELSCVKTINGENRWLWPRLDHLMVQQVSGEKVLRMVEARTGGAAVEVRVLDDQQQRPTRFATLILDRLCKISSDILEAIRKIIGTEVLLRS
ncbi:hypothetical protein FRB93_014027 [Tulasnella sp. JGI-2019a]|nr:hypothetical protein FRB93_014027 [Tulasnella sp. JGI-2019a]